MKDKAKPTYSKITLAYGIKKKGDGSTLYVNQP